MWIDARVPVVFGAIGDAGPDDALLLDGEMAAPDGRIVARLSGAPTPAHVAGCVCCAPQSEAGSALASLFLKRGRGEVGHFRRVLAITDNRDAVIAAVQGDVLASGWFRIS
jgi:hypothetical protein